MAEFRRVYPSEGKILLDGGLNSKYAKSIIDDSESPDCLNVVFGAGTVETRDGFKKINTASVGTFVCDGLYTRKGSGAAETMVAFYGGHGFTLTGTSMVTIPSAQSIYTAGQRIGTAQMENNLFIGNGAITPYKYNGSAFTRHGVPQAGQTTSFNTGAAGNPNGAYRYKIVYVNSALVEGNPSTASTTFTVANTKIELNSLPVAPQSHGVSAREIYRTVTSGATYFLVGTVNDNTTTTYSDNVADASLGQAAPSNKGEPPVYSTIIYHQNRLFMNDATNGALIWYTDLNEPYTVGTTNFLIIGDSSTDFVQSLAVMDNILIVFCQRYIWMIYMPTNLPADWEVIKSKSSYSSKSPFGNFEFLGRTGFPAVQNDKFIGIAALTGDSIDPSLTILNTVTAGSDMQSDRIEADMFDIQESFLGNISTTVFKQRAYIAMTKGAGNNTNNRVYVMDFSLQDANKNTKLAWVPWTGLNVAQFTIYSGNLYYGSSTATGFLYALNPGVYSDDGTAINSYYWTKEFQGFKQDESNTKDFRYTNVLVDLPGNYYMNIGYRTDSDSGSGVNQAVYLSTGSSTWGSMVWGVDVWGAGYEQGDRRVYLGGSRGKRIQYKFSNQNTVNQKFKVHWQNFTYNLKGAR